jgi:hypothetical protein
VIKDVYKQPFITVGFTAFPLMIPLAVTIGTLRLYRLFVPFGGRLHPTRVPGSVVRYLSQ